MWTQPGNLFDHASLLTFGLRAQIGRRNQTIFLNGAGVPPKLGSVLGAEFADNRLVAQNVTVWIDHQLALGRGFTLITSLSAARANRINDDRFAGIRAERPDSSSSLNSAALLPRLGLRYDRKHFQWFANVTRSYEPLTWDELLATVPGTGSGDGLISGSDPRRVAPTSYAALAYELIPSRRGAHGLVLRASYTSSDFYFERDAGWGRDALPVIPPHVIQVALDYHHRSGSYGAAMLNW